jgi:hypothetical protein
MELPNEEVKERYSLRVETFARPISACVTEVDYCLSVFLDF